MSKLEPDFNFDDCVIFMVPSEAAATFLRLLQQQGPLTPRPAQNLERRGRNRQQPLTLPQQLALHKKFAETWYPTWDERVQLASRHQLSVQRVTTWFNSRRAQLRRRQRTEQQRLMWSSIPAPRDLESLFEDLDDFSLHLQFPEEF